MITEHDLFAWADGMEQQMKDVKEMETYLTFDAYQEFTDSTAIYPDHKALEYLALGLTSEAGEVAGKIKKWIRDGIFDVDDVAAEIGDVIWYCAQLCSTLELYMSEVVKENVDKLSDRKERNMIGGNGDKR